MTIELYKNSLVTLDEAENYFDLRYDSGKWFELEKNDKEKLLITASKKMNSFDFVGTPLQPTQPMVFPRSCGTPQDIKDAVCEEALEIAKKASDVHKLNQDHNITSISLGAGSVSYGNTSTFGEAKILVSASAVYLVNKWIKKGFNLP